MSQSASQVSTRSAPVAARERHCHYSSSALLSCPLPLTPVPSLITGIFSFCSENSISALHNVINRIRRLFACIAQKKKKKNHSMNTVNRLSNCIALLRKEVLRRSATRVQGLTVVQMIVSVNVSLGLFVSWLSEQCVMSSEPSDTLLSVALIISPQMQSLWWWQAEVIVLHRPCEFLFFFSRNHLAECPRDFHCGCNGRACTQSPIHNAMRNLSDPYEICGFRRACWGSDLR